MFLGLLRLLSIDILFSVNKRLFYIFDTVALHAFLPFESESRNRDVHVPGDLCPPTWGRGSCFSILIFYLYLLVVRFFLPRAFFLVLFSPTFC